jgi:alanine racemase
MTDTAWQQWLRQRHRPAWAEIDLDGIAHNIRAFQQLLPRAARIMAVVKANAYGHGAVEVATAALEAGASRLAVAIVEEGIVLRQRGITAPIQLLGVSAPGTQRAVIEHDLIPTICTIDSARRFAEIGGKLGTSVKFHLKLDTGMGRIGVRPDDLPAFLTALKPLPHLEMEGVFSHFAKADEADKTYSARQLTRYRDCVTLVQEAGFRPRIRGLANSAAAIDLPDAVFDLIRLGISLYGLYPSDEVERERIRLRPVMSWKTRIVHLKTLPAGEAVSYGGRFVTQRPTIVATLPIGYADGFRRRLWSVGGRVLVQGRCAPIIGRVCMDMTMIDVTDLPPVSLGDEVVLLGTQGDQAISADEMAAQLDTINYEITCLVGKRVPRVYRRDGRIVGIRSLLGDQPGEELSLSGN